MPNFFHNNMCDLGIGRGIHSQSFWAQNMYQKLMISQP